MPSEKKVDYTAYIKELKKPTILWSLSLIGVFIIFSTPIKELYNTFFIKTLLHFCPKGNYFVDLVFLGYFFRSIYFLYEQLKKRLLISINSLFFTISILVIYLNFFRYSEQYDFYFFKLWLFHKLTYSDSFIVGTLIFSATYKSYLKALALPVTRFSLIEDGPSLTDYTDIYSREKYACEVASHISKTTTQNSFAIGIIGEWGSGKTDFLLRLKKSLSLDNDNIVFDFNPWRVSKSEAIVEDFFKTLSNEIRPFNQSINSKIKAYSKKILQTGKEFQYKLIDTLLGELIEDESIQKQYASINSEIKATAKRMIVIIDDVDRLTGKEVMEVLRIIRNTANFSNTFFIVGIDQKYIINVLKNTKDFANEEEYLKKVFQLTITLPAFKKDVFINQIKDFLITEDMDDKERNLITGALSRLSFDTTDVSFAFYPAIPQENILEKLIDNVRDLKRFCNSFKIAFNILKGEIDIYDLFVLELIRNRNIELYNLIKNRIILGFDVDRSDQFIIKEDTWANFVKEVEPHIGKTEIKNLKEAIDYIVKDEGYKNTRKFKAIHNFYLYFSYQLFNLISFNEYNSTIERDTEVIIAKFNEWSDNGKQSELLRITQEILDFPNSDFLLKMITVYLNIKSNHISWYQEVYKLVFHFRASNHEKYFGKDDQKHKEFLMTLMKTDAISLFDRASLAKEFLEGHIKKASIEKSFIFNKKEWQKVIYCLFDQYLKNIENLDSTSLNFYCLNDDKRIDGNNVLLYLPASRRLKIALMNNETFFADYVRMLIRSAIGIVLNGDVEINLFVFEPFLEQIFGNWQVFKEHLIQANFTDEKLVTIKRIILSKIDQFYYNKQAFQITSKEEKLFVKNMIIEVNSK